MPLSHPGGQSEVAQLRARIEQEHQAACYALTSPAVGAAQHWFIVRRMERIGDYQQRLSALVGESASVEIVAQIWDSSPAQKPGALGGESSGNSRSARKIDH